jgi:hypothetical protein
MCGCLSAADSATQACKSGLLCKCWAEAACGCLAESTTVPSPRRRKPSFDEEQHPPGQCLSALASPAAQHASCCLPALAASTKQQVTPAGVPRTAAAPAACRAPLLTAGAAGAYRSPSVSHPGRSARPATPPDLATQGAAGCEVVSICCRFGTYDTFVLAAFSFATSTAEFAARTGIAAGDARRRQPMVRFCPLPAHSRPQRFSIHAPYMCMGRGQRALGKWRPCCSGLPSLQRLGHPPTRMRRTRCLACIRFAKGTRRMTSSCWSLASGRRMLSNGAACSAQQCMSCIPHKPDLVQTVLLGSDAGKARKALCHGPEHSCVLPSDACEHFQASDECEQDVGLGQCW